MLLPYRVGNERKALTLYSTETNDSYKSFSKIDDVYHYVLQNFKDDVDLKKISGLSFLNEADFCRYFKRQTKNIFSQFVNQVRITHVTSLLLDKNKSIADVCYECGFNNLSYFNRQFKTITKKSPLKLRKLYDQP